MNQSIRLYTLATMPVLPQNPSLKNFQQYVTELEQERGFTDQNIFQKCLLFGEEVGELYKAVRKDQKMKIDANSQVGQVEGELADLLIYLCAIANKCNVDLEKAFREKEEINKNRVWSSSPAVSANSQILQ